MRDLIRFDDAQKAVCDGCSRQFGDAAQVRRGEWKETVVIENDCILKYWTCSACGKRVFCAYNFCPNCGADMRGEKDG